MPRPMNEHVQRRILSLRKAGKEVNLAEANLAEAKPGASMGNLVI